MTCSSCGTENRAGRNSARTAARRSRFACPSCGARTSPATASAASAARRSTAAPARRRRPARPRRSRSARLVSVLFADLVGFTALSETRDPEEVRELLSPLLRDGADAHRPLRRHGREVHRRRGDGRLGRAGRARGRRRASRPRRARLVAAVAALGDEVGAPDLRARAGVATGEAAVTLGAEGQGMVAGDLVNTAARVQSAAEPGTVLVDRATRRATRGRDRLRGRRRPTTERQGRARARSRGRFA